MALYDELELTFHYYIAIWMKLKEGRTNIYAVRIVIFDYDYFIVNASSVFPYCHDTNFTIRNKRGLCPAKR